MSTGICSRDIDDVEDKRYLLVAAYTWPQIHVEPEAPRHQKTDQIHIRNRRIRMFLESRGRC